MCGICGVFRPDRDIGPGDRFAVNRMMRRLEHRGPDGAGLWADGNVVLGHRRLAIIDITGGHQPILNESGDIGVVFNGEIYNFRELREQLEAAGHRFRTRSDTEVLVHGYETWGEKLLDRLRGMFAFVLWDARARRMLMARDRLGVKPLYYHRAADGRLIFASEVKALFIDETVPRALNHPRLAEYLVFRSIAGEETLFEGIREVRPGAYFVLDRDGVRERQYWSAERAIQEYGPSANESLDRARRLLTDAVRARLVSDVRLGTITSGGLDSSLVSAVAAEAAPDSIDTFCVGFADPAYDERPYARDVAARIRSLHHEIEVSPSQIEDELDRLTWAHDEPLTHPNSIPMHLIFREAKENQGVTVLLSGEGADEVFGGYEWYDVAFRRQRLRRVPGLTLARHFVPGARGRLLRRVMHRDYLLAANANTWPDAVFPLLGLADDHLATRRELWPRGAAGVDGLFVYDQRTYLPPLLQRQDRMSMAAGLEARVPFLDHPLVEWANALPAATKLRRGDRKGLLKDVAVTWLSDRIINREKVGFAMPIADWLRPGGPLAERVRALEAETSFARSLIRQGPLRSIVAEHNARAADHAGLLWTLVALDSWAATFLGRAVHDAVLPGAATGRVLAGEPLGDAGGTL